MCGVCQTRRDRLPICLAVKEPTSVLWSCPKPAQRGGEERRGEEREGEKKWERERESEGDKEKERERDIKREGEEKSSSHSAGKATHVQKWD